MSEVENTGMSLASIAGMDVSEVEELRSSQLAAGLYVFEVTNPEFGERMVNTKDGDEEKRYVATIPLKVIEVEAVTEKNVEEADVMGKTQTENFFINPAEAEKGIGYLKGFIADIGCDSAGPIGGVEGGPEGFLDKAAGHRFRAKIVKKKGKDGEMYSRLQLIKTKK